jgi:hypothetical protein
MTHPRSIVAADRAIFQTGREERCPTGNNDGVHQFGVPTRGCANLAWVQRSIYHLAPQDGFSDRRKQMLVIDARKLNRPCRDLAHVGTERTDAAIQVWPGENGEAKCEYTFQRDIHFKAA